MNRIGLSGGVLLAGLLLAGGLTSACGSSNAQPVTASAGEPEGVPVGNDAEEEHGAEADTLRSFHRHHHVGFIGFALMSIPTLGVTPDQQAFVSKIQADLNAKFKPAYDAEATLLNVLADGVAAGTIDQAKVDAATAQIAAVSTQMDDATNGALNELHSVLTPPEREALALKVQAHFLIWQRANADEDAQTKEHEEGGHISHLAKELALSPDQVEKIRGAYASGMEAHYKAHGKWDAGPAEAHLKAFINAFPQDHFDAATLTTADKANSSVASWGAWRIARVYDAMNPILTPDQRTKLAAMLRDHATKLELK